MEDSYNVFLLSIIRRRGQRSLRLGFAVFAAVWLAHCLNASFAQDNKSQPPAAKQSRLLDRQPFDRITLDAANGNEPIDTLLLEFPNRQVPEPLPTAGTLELRRLSEPSVLYTLPWTAIEKVELYEQLLLNEAIELAKTKDLKQSFDYFNFLHKNYPNLPGLKNATAGYLRLDAQEAYREKRYEETLTILLALYDSNPKQRGLPRFVESVTDRLIEKHLANRNFAAARSVLDGLKEGFPQLEIANVKKWQEKFEQGAERQIAIARKAIDSESYTEARRALRRAQAILPDADGVNEMMREVDRKSPQLIVGVDSLVRAHENPLDWSTKRINSLTRAMLIDLADFGAEAGIYKCEWANLTSDDTGLILEITLNEAALQKGINAESVALQLLRQADPHFPEFRAQFASLLKHIEISRGDQVKIHWMHSHVRPESLLPLTLKQLVGSESVFGEYEPKLESDSPEQVSYQLPNSAETIGGPKNIIEKYIENEEEAVAALLNGDIDVIARLPPWQVSRLEQSREVKVSPYRLPTVHVLIPNYEKPLMGRREFRRAICYGINREQILSDILLAGERRAGFRVMSAPLPAGVTITDPVGYAYNQGRQPRSYEPRLAAVLAAVARNSLAKLEAMKQAASKQKSDDEGESAEDEQLPEIKVEPIILAHPPNAAATTACQSIKLQLGAIGIPIKLQPIAYNESELPQNYDIRYAELAIWEPIVDARRLLGPEGIAGHCSSSMSLALRDVEQAQNWKDVRARLKEVHEIAYNDLPVIPLWQTLDFFAHRESIRGIGATPVTLYINVSDWQRGGRR